MSTGCDTTFFLSHADLRLLDEYTEQLGNLIARFLKIVFMSMLWSQKDLSSREAIGLRMTQHYLQAFDVSGAAIAAPSKSGARHFVAALWEDGRMFTAIICNPCGFWFLTLIALFAIIWVDGTEFRWTREETAAALEPRRIKYDRRKLELHPVVE